LWIGMAGCDLLFLFLRSNFLSLSMEPAIA
jgi:hypothetical protein